MSELKAIDVDKMADVRSLSGQFYLKSEADKVIARHKYKRCLAMAWWCSAELGMLVSTWESKIKHYKKWQQRWLELAEKFKEAK
jgi:hypothetical protein